MVPGSPCERRSGRTALARTLVTLAGVAAGLLPARASADASKQACIEANEQSQVALRAGKLHRAHEQAVLCASDACPPLVRADCARLLTEVSDRQPTVVVDARDASGAETIEIRMFVDGALVAGSLDGLEVELDPGPHTLRFETKSDGRRQEQQMVLHEGEKRRRLVVNFKPPATAGTTSREGPPRLTPSSPARRLPVASIVLGGIGVAGAASFGIFAAVGYSKERNLASSCSPHCTSDAVSPVKTDYLVADVSLGLAAVALGGAVVFALLGHEQRPPVTAWRLGVGPLHGGASVSAEMGW
jgi:hypothetical protein